MPPRIAVVGSNMMDLVTTGSRMPARGETLAATGFAVGFGGKGANQAVAAARLGAEVTMVTKVGDDDFGARQMANFAANGIDTRHVGTIAGVPSGVAPIFVDEEGENAILIVKGANDRLMPADVDAAAEALKGCGIILLQNEVPAETIYRAISFGAENGVPVLFNPAPADAGLDMDKISAVTFLVPNETELALLSGMPVDTDAAVEAAARSLVERGVGTVIVTMGGRGAMLVEKDAVHQVAPVKVVPIDTTGAGDAFIGAFARFYVASGDTRASLAMAARFAAMSITRSGTQSSYPTLAEFEAFAG